MNELLDILIEENLRLNERLKQVGAKSAKRRRQLRNLQKGLNRVASKVRLLERGNKTKADQITLYANELVTFKKTTDSETYELLKERERLIEGLNKRDDELRLANEQVAELLKKLEGRSLWQRFKALLGM